MKYAYYSLSIKRTCWITLFSLGLAAIHLIPIVIISLIKNDIGAFVGYFILLLIDLSSIPMEVCSDFKIGVKYMVPTYVLSMVATGPLLLAECGVETKIWLYIVPISEIVIGILGLIIISRIDDRNKAKHKKQKGKK